MSTAYQRRIAVMVSCFQYGGAELQALHLVRFLRSQGTDVTMWALVCGGPLNEQLAAEKIPMRVLGFRRPSALRNWPRQLLRGE